MLKRRKLILKQIILTAVLLLFYPKLIFPQQPVNRAEYLAYARSAADWTWQNYDERIEKWKSSFDPDNVFGYRPPGGLLEMAVIPLMQPYTRLIKD